MNNSHIVSFGLRERRWSSLLKSCHTLLEFAISPSNSPSIDMNIRFLKSEIVMSLFVEVHSIV